MGQSISGRLSVATPQLGRACEQRVAKWLKQVQAWCADMVVGVRSCNAHPMVATPHRTIFNGRMGLVPREQLSDRFWRRDTHTTPVTISRLWRSLQ